MIFVEKEALLKKSFALRDGKAKIYVVTTGAKERVERVKSYFDGIDFSFIFSDDFGFLETQEKKYESVSHKFRQKSLMAGEIGAFKTHSYAWEVVAKSGRPAVIIEDNVEFLKPPCMLLDKKIVDLIERCGVISFTDFSFKMNHESPFLISSVLMRKPLPIVCYGITPERAMSLLKAMEKNPYVLPVDKWLSIPKLCGCCCFLSPVSFAKRAGDVSSIANKRKGKKTYNPFNFFCRILNKIRYRY